MHLWLLLLLLLLPPPLMCAQSAGGPWNYTCGVVARSAFHFTDPGGCAINDPNAPFWDADHGIYHLFYQNHVWLPVNKSDCTSGGPGPTWGHAISRDMVTWDPLPPALWNSDWYDRCAVYTGSATIMPDGSPAIMYPGICEQDDHSHNCTTGTNLNLAFPTNRADPTLTNWTKFEGNPVVLNTGRDPTGAWRTQDQEEWRVATFDGQVFFSTDFRAWSRANGTAGFPTGECPSLMPLPPPAPGSTIETNPNITHVFKHGGSWHDNYAVGHYNDGPPGTAGTWTTVPTLAGQHVDGDPTLNVGSAYAAKDFVAKGRRMLWTWGFGLPGMLIPRELFWDADVQQLVQTPLHEFSQLRRVALSTVRNDTVLAVGENRIISKGWPVGAGNQTEVLVKFTVPALGGCASRVGVGLLLGDRTNQSAFVEWTAPAPAPALVAAGLPVEEFTYGSPLASVHRIVKVGTGSPDRQMYNRSMPGVSLDAPWSASCLRPNGAGRYSVHGNNTCLGERCDPHGCCAPTTKTASDCEAACETTPDCVAWSYFPDQQTGVFPALNSSPGFHTPCVLLDGFPKPNPRPNRTAPTAPISGLKAGIHPPQFAAPDAADGLSVEIPHGASTVEIELRIFIDGTTLEVFYNGGRTAIAWRGDGGGVTSSEVSLFNQPMTDADGTLRGGEQENKFSKACPIVVHSAEAWQMGSIWEQ